MSLQAAVNAEAVSMTLHRNIGGVYDVNGEFVPNAHQALTIIGTIQPASGKVLRDLPEGLRATATYTLWTTATVAVGDVIVYGGGNHRVAIVKVRPEGGFTRAILSKMGI